jgi:Tol biopolymer transport system component
MAGRGPQSEQRGAAVDDRHRHPTYLALAGAGSVLALVTSVVAPVGAATAAAGLTELVSVRSNGHQGDGISGRASAPSVSANGLVVAFDSAATNLVGGDTNGAVDVFVRDRASGRTERVSVSGKGKQGNGGSAGPAVSDDGRFVAFESSATNLVPGDTNGRTDIFVRDRVAGATTRASVAADGTQSDNVSFGSAISADGRFVAFVSDASNLVPEPASGRQVYVKDLVTGAVERVSVSSGGDPAQGFTTPPAISGDGRVVTFAAAASNLVPGDTNGQLDVFAHDRVTGVTERVSVDSAGGEGDGPSFIPDINGDGRFVTFASEASNLVGGDTNGVRDVFVHDRATGVTERVSVDSAGSEANGQSIGPGIRGGSAFGSSISADGRLVAFDSIATNLVPGDTNTCGPFYQSPAGACPDVFVHDRMTGATVRVSVDSTGGQADGASTDPDISADGSTAAFFSAATNLVVGDTNTCGGFPNPGECPDIFVHV